MSSINHHMPTGKNWFNLIWVTLGFMVYTVCVYYLSSIKEIKDNWPVYRCNPMYMPLSDDMSSDFTYCVQNITTSFMGHLLQPLTFITSTLSEMGSNFTTELNGVRGMISKIRTMFSNIMQSIMGVFMNLMIEFQKVIIGLKDMVAKTIGIVTTLLFVMDGSIKTMESAWNGPSGQLVKALGKCFHPDTQVQLRSGEVVLMKDLNLGDVLQNGSMVNSVMKICNKERKEIGQHRETFYKIKGKGVNNRDILVTGSHMIFNAAKNKFVEVKDYPGAELTKTSTDWFSCLITHDHKIHVGTEIFWDWEDHFIKTNRN